MKAQTEYFAYCIAAVALAFSHPLLAQTTGRIIDTSGQQTLLTNQSPFFRDATDNTPYEMGTKFTTSRDGFITGIRYWKPVSENNIAPTDPSQTYTHTGTIWASQSAACCGGLATAYFYHESPEGWQTAPVRLRVKAGDTYVVSVNVQSNYAATNDVFGAPLTNGWLTGLADGNNGVFGPPGILPVHSYRNSNYFRDVVFVPTNSIVAISAGGSTASLSSNREFAPGYYIGSLNDGLTSTTLGIDRSGVFRPAPEPVYQTARYGIPDINYAIAGAQDARGTPNFVPGTAYKVRLHFAELNFTRPGERKFNVKINSDQVLSDFDIVAAAGAPYRAVVKEFTATAFNQQGFGTITVQFSRGSASVPLISAIEILPATTTIQTP